MTDTVAASGVDAGQGVAMMDGGAFVPRSELEARFEAINLRIGNVEKATAAMATAQAQMLEKFDANTEKLDAILGFMAHANTWVGFLKKHGPKVGYFVIGVAISRGWITGENGKNLLHLFTG